jgi:hydrogenase maturation protein HypF
LPDESIVPYPFPLHERELDFAPLLNSVMQDRIAGRSLGEIATAFHLGVAQGLATAAASIAHWHGVKTVVASGGVFQNVLLLDAFEANLRSEHLALWLNEKVPANDGGISLGQAAMASRDDGALNHA